MGENNLIVKDIIFNGDILRAAKENDSIWVGVSWVCQGLGLSKNQKDRQVKNIQTDKLLSRGCVKFDAGVFDANNETLALMLDYLPAWLFKIKITPKMERDKPQLVEKLIAYQLKAKDVLAEAFISKKDPVYAIDAAKIKSYEEKIDMLQSTIDRVYKDMSSLANLFIDWKEDKTKDVAKSEESWRHKISAKIDELCKNNIEFKNKADVLKYIYKYMNRKYGVVWEQEIKDCKDRNHLTRRPSTLEVVEDMPMLRSIFEAVLTDMICNTHPQAVIVNGDDIDQLIAPLIKRYHDKSHAAMVTWRRIYKKMEESNTISWNNLTTRYRNEYGKNPTRRNLIETRPSLRKKFETAVHDLLNED